MSNKEPQNVAGVKIVQQLHFLLFSKSYLNLREDNS